MIQRQNWRRIMVWTVPSYYWLRMRFEPIKRSYVLPGASTLEVEVTNVSKRGFWLLLGDEELFVPFAEFPWFKDAPIAKILNVEHLHGHHLHWPDLDVDLAVESIRHPEQYPLVARSSS